MSLARMHNTRRRASAACAEMRRRSSPPGESPARSRPASPPAQALRVPPNSPQISASRILHQLISRNSLVNSASRCVRPGVALESESSSSVSADSALGSEGECAGAGAGAGAEGVEGEALARWERWRAETLAARPPAPPFVFSLRTRRLPPHADGRVRSVPCSVLGASPPMPSTSCERRKAPVAAAPQQQRPADPQRQSDASGGEGKPLAPVSWVLCSEKKSPSAAPPATSSRSQRVTRPARHAPSSSALDAAAARPRQISSQSSKQSQQSKEDEKPPRRQTVEAYVREKLSHLHPSDHFLKTGSKGLSGDTGKTHTWFELRRKLPLSPEVGHASKDALKDPQTRQEKEALCGNELQQNGDRKQRMKKNSTTQQGTIDGKKCIRKSTVRKQSANSRSHKLSTVTSSESAESKYKTPEMKTSPTKITSDPNLSIGNNINQDRYKVRRPYQLSGRQRSNAECARMNNERETGNFQQRPATLIASKRGYGRRRVAKQSEDSPFRCNLYRKPLFYPAERDYKVTVINSGVVVYMPRSGRLTNAVRRKSRPIRARKKILTKVKSQRYSGFPEGISTPPHHNSTPPKDGILKYTASNEESDNQCPLRRNLAVQETDGNICILRSISSDSPITPSEKSILKQKAVRFEISEADKSQKRMMPSTNICVPDLLGADDIDEYVGFKESVDSASSAQSGLYETMNSPWLKPPSPFDTPGVVYENKIIDSPNDYDSCHGDRNIVTPLLGTITDLYGPQGTCTTGGARNQPTIISNELCEPMRQIVVANAQISQLKTDVVKRKGRIAFARGNSKRRGKCSPDKSKPVCTVETEESTKLPDILPQTSTTSTSTTASESQETTTSENIRLCTGTTNIRDACSAYVTYLPTRSKPDRKTSKPKKFSTNPCKLTHLRSTNRQAQSTPLASPTQTLNSGNSAGGNAAVGETGKDLQLQVLYASADRPESPFSEWGGLPGVCGTLADAGACRPDYSALKPPWPDPGGADIHPRPPPPPPRHQGSAREQMLRARERRASALSSRLPAVNTPLPPTMIFSCPPGESTLHYLRKRLLEERQAMQELEARRRPSPLARCLSPPPLPAPPTQPYPFPFGFRARRTHARCLLPPHRGVRSVVVR